MTAAEQRKTQDDDLFKQITQHFDNSTEQFKETFNKKFDELGVRVEENTTNIHEIKKAIQRIEAVKGPADIKNADLSPPSKLDSFYRVNKTREKILDHEDRRADKYNRCRRSLRIWPVDGKTDQEVNFETWRFIRNKLRVPDEELHGKQIERIRRIRSAKKAKIQFEVSILFEDIYTRDRVSSFAKNLAGFTNQDGSPSAGLHIEYPDFLGYTFRCLDWYGKDLKLRYGLDFRRNIRFDDDKQNLCMDVRFPDADG